MDRYRAIVLGATGAVGSALVHELLASPHCEVITMLTRRQVYPGLTGRDVLRERVIDMEDLERETAEAARGCTAAFCTMGIGQPRKVAKEEVWKVDVEYAAAFARGAQSAGVQRSATYLKPPGRRAEQNS
jgi:nucleoside-diphosphate-sugar epimerase